MRARLALALVAPAAAALFLLAATPAQATLILGSANLDSAQEVPPNSSDAVGVAILNVDDTTGLFDFDLFVTGIAVGDLANAGPNPSPVHLHSAPAGANGGIVVDVGFLGTITALGTTGFKLEVDGATFGGVQGALNGPDVATNIADLLAGELYVNVHTTSFPGGEIRGQIKPAVVPEPSALSLSGLALALGAGLVLRRRGR